MGIPYYYYLRSDGWRKLRRETIDRWRGFCSRCGRRPKSEAAIQIHHASYATDLRTVPMSELKPVCAKCHFKITKKRAENAAIQQVVQGEPTVMFAKKYDVALS